MNSTLQNFLKTNSSPHDFTSPHLASKHLFLAGCEVFYIKQPKLHIDWSSKANGWIWWKNENPCFENFSGVTVLILAIMEDEESPWFLEVWNSKSQKWVFHYRFCWSRVFRVYLRIWNWMGRNWDITIWRFWSIVKLGFRCQKWSNLKFQNGGFPMNSSWLIESITSDGWVELILLAFESSPSISDWGRWRVIRR